jgi:hypothetical protein
MRASSLATLVALDQHASVPLIILGVDVAKPQVALHTVHGSRQVARLVGWGDSLAAAV